MRRLFGIDGDRWVLYFWFVGWDCFSLGFHVCLSVPNFEIHLPFGFIRAGRKRLPPVFDEIELYVGSKLVAAWRESLCETKEVNYDTS